MKRNSTFIVPARCEQALGVAGQFHSGTYSNSDAVTTACPNTQVLRKPFDSHALRQMVFDLTIDRE